MNMIQSLVHSLRQKFEKKQESRSQSSNGFKSDGTKCGLVSERRQIYEKMTNNSPSGYSNSSKSKSKHMIKAIKEAPQTSASSSNKSKIKCRNQSIDENCNDDIQSIDNVFPDPNSQHNLDKTPSNIVNSDGLCLYQVEPFNGNLGSFKKRPKYAIKDDKLNNDRNNIPNNEIEIKITDTNGTETNDDERILMRMKKDESQYRSINRYESILTTAPLFQHSIVNRVHKSVRETMGVPSTSNDVSSRQGTVAQLISTFNQLDNSTSSGSDMDRKLLKTLCSQETMRRRNRITGEFQQQQPDTGTESTRASGMSHQTGNGEPDEIMVMLKQVKSCRWVDMEQVKQAKIIELLSEKEIAYYESQFELISSEASYYRSLMVLIDVFYTALSVNNPSESSNNQSKNIQDDHFELKPYQKDHLFSNILKIYSVSSNFLKKLEKMFISDIYMENICKIVSTFAKKDFDVYVPYLQNQKFQTETYNELKKDARACKLIDELESRPECACLTLDSFLLLPMQRLPRIKLLLVGIQNRIPVDKEFKKIQAQQAIDSTENILSLCSAKKDVMDERQRMLELCHILQFPNDQSTPQFTSGRILLEVNLKRSKKDHGSKSWFNSIRIGTQTANNEYLFILTNQYLLMVKVSKNGDHIVDDFCKLSELTLQPYSGISQSSVSFDPSLNSNQNSSECPFTNLTPPTSPNPASNKMKLIIQKSNNNVYSYIVQSSNKNVLENFLKQIEENRISE